MKEWFKTKLLPQLKPNTKIILDNASFHKRQDLEQVIEEAHCQLWYLPKYSPDLNPIERC
ncbi:transposase [Pseudocalidococcus azoricus]|uniref:transposase n=1 Tax=Pseudocalidococcus azoricus TaxID=3110322 RepID=UPI00389A1562